MPGLLPFANIATNIRGLFSNFVKCESFLESNCPDILGLCATNLDDSVDSDNFCLWLPSFNPKGFYYSYAWSWSLREESTSFCTSSYLCFRLALLHRVYFFFLYRSPSSSLCTVFDYISSSIQMRFYQSTHLLMCLLLETLTSIVRTG